MWYIYCIWIIGIPLAVYLLRDVVLGKGSNKYPLVFCASMWPLFMCGLATWKSVHYFTNLKGNHESEPITT